MRGFGSDRPSCPLVGTLIRICRVAYLLGFYFASRLPPAEIFPALPSSPHSHTHLQGVWPFRPLGGIRWVPRPPPLRVRVIILCYLAGGVTPWLGFGFGLRILLFYSGC